MKESALHIAPVQGHTDAAWRHFHHKEYGGENIYYTPFIRNEKGDFRDRDIRDFLSALNEDINLVPQVIFRNMEELRPLLSGLRERGASSIDLNMGCPFPLQTARGRGAAFIGNKEELVRLPELLSEFTDVEFSVKMRLGYDNPAEWRHAIGILNSIPLRHITLHPRMAKEQYGGEVHYDEFSEFLAESVNPVIYNGDLKTPDDFFMIKEKFPEVAGIMIGRGVLGRPSLMAEVSGNEEWNREKRISKMMNFHARLLDYYEETLCGDSQVLSKIKPFWEYAEEEIGRRAWKAIKKSSNKAKYHSAVAMISSH